MGFIYGGLQFISSLLLLINSSHLVADGSVVGICTLITSLIVLVAVIILITGFFMRKAIFVTIHLRFVTTIYVLLMIILFVCCIVDGVKYSSHDEIPDAKQREVAVTGITAITILWIVYATLFYSLISWILNGVIQRNQLVIVHLIWVAFSYVLLVITLFVYGVILGKRAATYELVQKSDFQGDLMMALTALHITSFALLSIFYAFIAWILNGVIGASSETKKTIDAKNTNLYIE
ncbi:hypothetical protein pipiens_015398 [Culex pipiens pipiens]|uniref:Uncharacterized protein n=1 Tax=Culex pipiens pipiens TaxID=38569 RepID=A0ABD1CQN2_CULPP